MAAQPHRHRHAAPPASAGNPDDRDSDQGLGHFQKLLILDEGKPMAMSLSLVILTPFLGAALVAGVSRLGRPHAAWMAGAVTLLALAWLLPLMHPPRWPDKP
jgi:hypothetical protein